MGNRLSGLWCKKTTLSITHEEFTKKPSDTSGGSSDKNRTTSSNKSGRNRSDGRGIFRIGSVRRLSLTNKKQISNKTELPEDRAIATVEQTYRELTNSSMKVNAPLMPLATVKVSSSTRHIPHTAGLKQQLCHLNGNSNSNGIRNRYACRNENKSQT